MTNNQIPRVVTVHDGTGYRTGLLVTEGPKYASFIWADASGVRVTRLPWVERLKYGIVKLTTRDVDFKGKPYPVARAKRFLRGAGKRYGITKEARRLLRA